MTAPIGPLFRPEVAAARGERLHGEIVLSQPVRAQLLVLLLTASIAVVVAWLTMGQYTRTETARGMLVTTEAASKIMATRPGQVTELSVKEGDAVRPGDKLAIVRVEHVDEAGKSAIGSSLGAIDAQRILADQQIRLSSAKAESERLRLGATLSGFQQQRHDLREQIALQQDLVKSALQTFEQLTAVAEKGFVSRSEAERRRQDYLIARQQLSRLEQQFGSLETEESRTRAELARLTAETGSEVATVQASEQMLAQQKAQLQGERAYVLTAPIAGRVTALQASVGRVVDGSMPLMVITPEKSMLRANIYAPTRAIGFVKPGQEVRLLYDAFPYQRFGSFKGRIEIISRVAMDPRELDVPFKVDEPVYRISVVPDAQGLEAFGQRLPLQAGMTLTANIILDRRSFLDWLLEPLNAVMRRNG